MMQKERSAANSTVEDQCEYGVINKVAIHDAAPEEVAVCKNHQHFSQARQVYMQQIRCNFCLIFHVQ